MRCPPDGATVHYFIIQAVAANDEMSSISGVQVSEFTGGVRVSNMRIVAIGNGCHNNKM